MYVVIVGVYNASVSLTWPDRFFPFVLGPDPTQKGKSGLATRDYASVMGERNS